MKRLKMIFLSVLLISKYSIADTGQAAVTEMLKSNPIVISATKQAKEYVGSDFCNYKVVAQALGQFEKGSAYQYNAEIICNKKGKNESSAIINVSGQYIRSSGKNQALNLSILFAD